MSPTLTVREIDATHSDRIIELAVQLSDAYTPELLRPRLADMWRHDGYHCLGLFSAEDELVGIASAWLSVRLYGGQIMELDNVVIDAAHRGGGAGAFFLRQIERWAEARGVRRSELKTYVSNPRSHKFYFRHDYSIYAYYFVKPLK